MREQYLFTAACALALIGLVGVTIAATPAVTSSSVTLYHYLTRWGCEGTGDGQFDCASDIVVDSAGNIYVSESKVIYNYGPRGNSRIQKFTSDGTFVTKWGTEGGGALDIDPTGTVYLSEGGRIRRFSPNGTLISTWGPYGTDGELGSIAVDGAGTVFALAPDTSNVLTIDTNGTLVGRWQVPGEYSQITDIDVDSTGTVYVVDLEHGIVKFSSNGTYLTTIDAYYPFHLTIDAADDYWLMHKHGVSKYTSSGVFIAELCGEDLARGINAMAVDGAGNVYTLWNECAVLKWAPGAWTPGSPLQYHFITKWGTEGTSPGKLDHPEDIADDGAGHLYVADTYNHRLQKFTSSGLFVATWGGQGTGDGQFNEPGGVAVDAAGNVYVADSMNHRVQKFTSAGTFITKWGSEGSGNGQFNNPVGVAIDPAGNVYVVERLGNRVQKFTPNGTFVEKWGRQGFCCGDFEYPVGIAIDPVGTVYVADSNGVQKFTPDGMFVSRITGLSRGDAIAVDDDGGVYAIRSEEILVFSSDGTFVARWGSYGDGDGQFTGPSGIAVDGAGYVYVVEVGNNRVQQFAPGASTPTPTPTPGPYGPLVIPGRIEAEDYNLGGEGIAYHDTTSGNSGGIYRRDDVDIESIAGEGSPSVGWIRNGEWLTYTATITTTGQYTLRARVASPNSGRTMALVVDNATGATMTVPNTGSFTRFTTVTVPIMLTAGKHTLRLTFSGDGQNLNWLDFAAEGATPTPTPVPTTGPYKPLVIPGRIEAEDYNLGGEGIAYHDTTRGNSGGIYRRDDVDIENIAGEGSPSVGWIRNGEWLTYTATITTSGPYTVKARVANPNPPRTMGLSIDGTRSATLTVPTTWSFGKFTTVQVPVTLSAGTHTIRLTFSGDGQNLNWIEFGKATAPTPTPTPTPGAGGASFIAVPVTAPHGSAVKFTVTPAAGRTVRAAWWTFDSVAHYATWNSRAINPTFFYPSAGTFSPLVKLTYSDGSTETVARAYYVRAT